MRSVINQLVIEYHRKLRNFILEMREEKVSDSRILDGVLELIK